MADTLHVLTCTCLGTLVYLGYMYLLYKSTYVAVPLEYIQGPSITVEKHVSMGNENWATYTWAGKCVPPPPWYYRVPPLPVCRKRETRVIVNNHSDSNSNHKQNKIVKQ